MSKKRKINWFQVVRNVLFITIGVIITLYYIINLFDKPPHVKYPAFGINIPPNYLIHGIDVSRHQRTINWEDVKEMKVKNIKLGFAFIKATEGLGMVDEQFRRNWLKAEEAGMPKGAYHFFIAGKSGKVQAKNFIEIVKLKSGDLPPVLDVEELYNTDPKIMRQQVSEWLTIVENYYNIKPIIYTNIHFYNKYLQGDFEDYNFWFAHYQQADKPRVEQKWLFWQHNEQGRVNGIKTPVDFNVFVGDSTAFRSLLIP